MTPRTPTDHHTFYPIAGRRAACGAASAPTGGAPAHVEATQPARPGSRGREPRCPTGLKAGLLRHELKRVALRPRAPIRAQVRKSHHAEAHCREMGAPTSVLLNFLRVCYSQFASETDHDIALRSCAARTCAAKLGVQRPLQL